MAKSTNTLQIRWFGEGNALNGPDNLIGALTAGEDLISLLKAEYTKPIFFSRLGIQSAPGLKVYINTDTEYVLVGLTGIFEIELSKFNDSLTSLKFDATNQLNVLNTGIIIDLVYEEATSDD